MGIFSIALQAALGFAKAVISAKKGNLKTSVSLTKKTKDGKTTLKSMDELVYEVVESAYGNYIRGKTTTMARFVGHPSVMLSPIEQLKLTMELYEPKIKCLIQENTTKKEEDIDVLDRIKEVGISYYSSYLKGLAGEQVIDKKYTLENLFTGKLTSEDMPDAITLLNMVAATKGAYYRGMYNGVKGIWDGGEMLVTETDKVLEGIYQSGSEFLEAPLKNTWEFLGDIKDGFIDSVWRSTPQEIAEDAGELAFDVAISVPTGGAGKVVSGAAKGIGKIKYLDNLVDIGKISQKIPSLQGMTLLAGGGFLTSNLADDFLKAPYQMIKPDGEDVAKLTAKGDDVVKQGIKEVKKPDTIDSQKVIKEKSGKETGSGVQITDSVTKTEVKDIVEKTEAKKNIDGNEISETNQLLPGEGNVGTYKELRDAGEVGDNLTPHHMPSAEYMLSKGVSRNDGLAMNIKMPSPGSGGRHRMTDTYGRNMTDAEKTYYYSLSPRDALAYDVKNLKQIYESQGLYSEIRPKIQEYIKKYKEYMPELFEKNRRSK